jgi:hypothetical protein
MTKYVVAYSDEVDAKIDQKTVDASSARDAAIQYLASYHDVNLTEQEHLELEDLDLLAKHFWDYYSASISVIKI